MHEITHKRGESIPDWRLGKKVGFIEAWNGSPKAVFESASA